MPANIKPMWAVPFVHGSPSLLSCSALARWIGSPSIPDHVSGRMPEFCVPISRLWVQAVPFPCLQNSLGQHRAGGPTSVQGAEAHRRARLCPVRRTVTSPRSYRERTNLLVLGGPTPLPGTLLLGSLQRGLGASLWGAWRHPLLSFSHVLLHLPFRQAKLALLITWDWPTSLLTGITPILVISRTVGWCL